ncbi:hypothetical protein ACF044_12245 [Microbacterium sp. NPDC016588]
MFSQPGEKSQSRWRGDLVLDGLIVRRWVSRLVLVGGGSRSELVHSSARPRSTEAAASLLLVGSGRDSPFGA